MKTLFCFCILLLVITQCYTQSDFPFGPVYTITSGNCDDTNPIIIDAGMFTSDEPWLVFVRNIETNSEIVGKKFITAASNLYWDTTIVTISQKQCAGAVRKPTGAITSFGRGGWDVYFKIVAWEFKKDSVWNIYYSVLFDNDSLWSSPQPLTKDTVDNTEIQIRAFKDSTFILAWKRKSVLLYSFLNPVSISLPETVAISNSNSFQFDIYTNHWNGAFVWTSYDASQKSTMIASAFNTYPAFAISEPKILSFEHDAYHPHFIYQNFSNSILFETDFGGNNEIWSMVDIFYQSRTVENLSQDSLTDDRHPKIFINPVITKIGTENRIAFFPFYYVLVVEKYTATDSMLYFAQGAYYSDTIKSVGYNRNASIGGRGNYFNNYLQIPIVWESNRSGRSHIYSRFVALLIDKIDDIPITKMSFHLAQNYPNPFNPSTTIKYQLPNSGHITLNVYDLLGREVATLVNEEMSAGEHSVQWNASAFPSGIYFYRLHAGNYTQTKKVTLLK